MKTFGKYISKHLLSFIALVVALLLLNVIAFAWTFHRAITEDYGKCSPENTLEKVAAVSSSKGTTEDIKSELHSRGIWAFYLNESGKIMWSCDTPSEIPECFSVKDVASFSKGYLENYPVFVWGTDDGLLVLGYPKDSYTKLTSNYYSIRAIKTLPVFLIAMVISDFLFLFFAYYLSKRKILKNTDPIISSVQSLSEGKLVSLSIHGELSQVANSVNKASKILSRQNEARANWISGVSHDIRTPLSMIMGYAGRIADNSEATSNIKEQAEIIERQSVKIKELVQDLNLVSQLEYDIQPVNKQSVRLSKLLRSTAADLLNNGIPEKYSIDIDVTPAGEKIVFNCDARLITRAINNLVHNSIKHNPQGCDIKLALDYRNDEINICVVDNGIGLSADKLNELSHKTHYMESTDEKLNLRHGLGLVLVRQITEAHGGTIKVESEPQKGFKTVLKFNEKQPTE